MAACHLYKKAERSISSRYESESHPLHIEKFKSHIRDSVERMESHIKRSELRAQSSTKRDQSSLMLKQVKLKLERSTGEGSESLNAESSPPPVTDEARLTSFSADVDESPHWQIIISDHRRQSCG